MDLVADIINMAFGLLLGAIAGAFGLGGGEAAGRAVARLFNDVDRIV